MIDTLCIEAGGPPLQSVDLVTFRAEKLGQIRSILARDAGNQGFWHDIDSSSRLRVIRIGILSYCALAARKPPITQ
jgi:hypothetical protein